MHCNLSQQALRAVQWVRWQSTHCVRESWGLCTARHGCTCGACRPRARWSPSVARAIGRSPSRRVIPSVVRHEQLGPCSNPAVVRHQQLGRSPAAFRLRRLSQRRRAMYTWHRFQHCWIRQAAKCWQRWHAASTSHRRVLQSNLQRRRLVQRPRAPARVRQSANLLGIQRLSQRRRAMYTWHRFQHCWIRQAAKCWHRWHAASTSHLLCRLVQYRRRLVQGPMAPARVRQSATLLGIRSPPPRCQNRFHHRCRRCAATSRRWASARRAEAARQGQSGNSLQ
jgi:hypothetical protein